MFLIANYSESHVTFGAWLCFCFFLLVYVTINYPNDCVILCVLTYVVGATISKSPVNHLSVIGTKRWAPLSDNVVWDDFPY